MFTGYNKNFIVEHPVEPPLLSQHQNRELVVTEKIPDGLVPYINYSLKLSSKRKFPFFTASNIDGKLFRKLKRKDHWRKDVRILKEYQWGPELYTAENSDFDKGHMTKREDVQWGLTDEDAIVAADSTFFYSNAVPQHSNLNRKIWRVLEDYILHTETKANELRINLFTGPVLSSKDPYLVTKVKAEYVQIPTLFWKVVYFRKNDDLLHCASFLMSQESLLKTNGLATSFRSELEAQTDEDRLFMEFEKAETYQVNLSTVEELSKLKFTSAIETYKDTRPVKLVIDEVDINAEAFYPPQSPEAKFGFRIANISI
ncbi:MAG TPA: DNA/RNA non-specific endonuclease [Chryseolinea sp.]|nr:DNA/RNA non-specific endonuclease [Chryseolinea sp.]